MQLALNGEPFNEEQESTCGVGQCQVT
eukprot:COSAG02_NODE_43547_length_373_cov_7.992701_1_plen_26_part_10